MGAVIDELKFWFGKNLGEYALENHRQVKKYYTRDIVKQQLAKMYGNRKMVESIYFSFRQGDSHSVRK